MQIAVTAVAAFTVVAGAVAPAARAEKLTIERLVASPSLDGRTVAGVKISPDGTRVTFLQGKANDAAVQDLWEYVVADGSLRRLVDSDALVPDSDVLDEVERARRERQRIFASGIIEYEWSPDGKALLFPLGGDLYYLPLGGEVRRLTETEAFETDARFSETGRYVSYVREQNLYATELDSGEEWAITSEGGGTLSFGVAEFVAQEEMYRNTGYWWSPDDRYIAYTRVNERAVQPVDLYEIDDTGVKVIPKRYPFAGSPNAEVDLMVIDVERGRVVKVEMGEDPDIYLARVKWLPSGRTLSFQRQSRDQKHLDLMFAEARNGRSHTILTETSETWLNLDNDLHFLDGGNRILWSSERSGYRHLYVFDRRGRQLAQLTDGAWAVGDEDRRGPAVKAVDEKVGYVYFEGFADSPLERHLYRVALNRPGKIERLTDEEGWHGTVVSLAGGLFVDFYSAPDVPPRAAIKSLDGKLKGYVRENALDEDHPYFPYLGDQAAKEFGALEAADGTVLYYFLMRPADFDPKRKYPAVISVYGGPGVGRQVTRQWGVGFNQILAQNGFIVFSVDGRGSPNRGKAFEDVLYHNMGDTELQDQLAGVAFLKSLEYVDGAHIGIRGGSYGGYMTLMALFKAGDVFRAGVSHAPVTDWRLYDTHYTERYLGHPLAPGEVYDKSSVFRYLDGYKGGLLLIHGMADDNVFFDNTVKLLKAMQTARMEFRFMAYPGQRHHLAGDDVQVQNLHMALNFLNETLKTRGQTIDEAEE